MVADNVIKRITKEVLKEAFFSYYSTAQKETRHLVLDRLFPVQRRTTSYMSGLQTSLGTSFWEKLASKLALLDGFLIIDNTELKKPNNVPQSLEELIDRTKRERELNGGSLITFRNELNRLYTTANQGVGYSQITKGKGSDLILSKDDNIYIYDIKTVQVNANNGNTFNETVILWLAYYKYRSGLDSNNITVELVFPYNSSDELNDSSWWTEYGDRVKPLSTNEVSVGNEFWQFITSNPNALNSIISGVEELSNEDEFIELFEGVFDCQSQEELKQFSKKVKVKYAEYLRDVTFDGNIEDVTSFNRKYLWKHDENCEGRIRARVKELSDGVSLRCSECNIEI